MLNDYIENRKEMLKSLMETFQFTRDQAKRIVGNRQWKTESAEIARLVFDGLMLYKNDVEGRLDELLDECMNEIKKAIEVDIRIVEKPIYCIANAVLNGSEDFQGDHDFDNHRLKMQTLQFQ